MDYLSSNRAGEVIARFTGLPVTRAISACRFVADQHGRPRYGRVKYTMTAEELGEAVPLAIAYSAGLTADLGAFRNAIIASGFAAALAGVIESVWAGEAADIFADVMTLDGDGRASWSREPHDEESIRDWGTPEGRAYVVHGNTLALIAQAARVAAPTRVPA